jgi:hypothetical protein
MIYSPRQSGKTTSAILRAVEKNAIIVCHSSESAKYTKQLAEKMGVSIKSPICCFDTARLKGKNVPIIIDNAELVLANFLGVSSIDTITLSAND